MNVIEAVGIRKSFHEGRETVDVLRGIDMHVRGGEVVALEGRSGSGKSTLLSILGCILTPSEGRLSLCGSSVDFRRDDDLVAKRKRYIGFVFQQYNLVPALTALENVELTLRIRGFGRRAARLRAEDVLREVSLEDRARQLPSHLSGGQKQRVAIARAIADNAPLVLADEPTANLDSGTGQEILRLFRDLASMRRCGVLIVTHDPQVRQVCDRVLRIHDGCLVESDA